jgi:predicted metal-dependent enzyme (double-stranded beta helix superfamily)
MLMTLNALSDVLAAHIFKTTSLLGLRHVVEQYQGVDWRPYAQFSDAGYMRHLIYRHELFEILLLCWNPMQSTALHDHPEQGCVLKVLQGTLWEEKYKIGIHEPFQTASLEAGSVGFMDNTMGIHRVTNKGELPAVSLHVYAPAGYQANLFEVISNCTEAAGR